MIAFFVYYIKGFFHSLFFKVFLKYKLSDSFLMACFFSFLAFVVLVSLSFILFSFWKCLISVFNIVFTFLRLLLLSFINWLLKNFFYLVTDLLFCFFRIRFFLFLGVSYYDPLVKIMSQKFSLMKGELLMDFYNFSNKFVFEDSFNVPLSNFSSITFLEPARNFHFVVQLQNSFAKLLQQQNKLRTFFFFSQKNKKSIVPVFSRIIFENSDSEFFFQVKQRLALFSLFFFNFCSIDFFKIINYFNLYLLRNSSSSFFVILLLKYFSMFKKAILFILLNLENDSFLNYLYLTLYRFSLLNYANKNDWNNLYNTYNLSNFNSLSFNGLVKHDFFFLLKITFAYFFIYFNYFLTFVFCIFCFLLKFFYYIFFMYTRDNFLFISYQYMLNSLLSSFFLFFYARLYKFFNYYRSRFAFFKFPSFKFFSNLGFVYPYIYLAYYYLVLEIFGWFRLVFSALIFLFLNMRTYSNFLFLNKEFSFSVDFFLRYFVNSHFFVDAHRRFSFLENFYGFPLVNIRKQLLSKSKRLPFFVLRWKYFLKFLQLKLFFFLGYSKINGRFINFFRMLFLESFLIIFIFLNKDLFNSLEKKEDSERLMLTFRRVHDVLFKQNSKDLLKSILILNFLFELICFPIIFLTRLVLQFLCFFDFSLILSSIRKLFHVLFLGFFFLVWFLYSFYSLFSFYFGFFVLFLFYCGFLVFFIHSLFFSFFGIFLFLVFLILCYLFFKVFYVFGLFLNSSVIVVYLCTLFKVFRAFLLFYCKLYNFIKLRNIGFFQVISIFFLIRNDLKKYEFIHSKFDYMIYNSLNLEFILNKFLDKAKNKNSSLKLPFTLFAFEKFREDTSVKYNSLIKYKMSNLRDKFIQLQIKNDLFPEFEYHKYLRLRDYANSSLFRFRRQIAPTDLYFDLAVDPVEKFDIGNNTRGSNFKIDFVNLFYQDDHLFSRSLLFFRSVFSRKNLSFFYDDLDSLSNFRVKYNKISPIFRYFYLKREKLKYLFSLYSFGNINYFSFSVLINWLSYYRVLRNVLHLFCSLNNSFIFFRRRSFTKWNLVGLDLLFSRFVILSVLHFKFFFILVFLCFWLFYFYCNYEFFYFFFAFLLLCLYSLDLYIVSKNIHTFVLQVLRKPVLFNFLLFLLSFFMPYKYKLRVLYLKFLPFKFGISVSLFFNFLFIFFVCLFGFDFYYFLINSFFSNIKFIFMFEDNVIFFYFFTGTLFTCFVFTVDFVLLYLLLLIISYVCLKFIFFRFCKRVYIKLDYSFLNFFLVLFFKFFRSFFFYLMSKFLIKPYHLLSELDLILRLKRMENQYLKDTFILKKR